MTGTDVAEILNAAADLIEKPGAWTQGTFARDAAGARVLSTATNASCWCALGAVIRTAFETGGDDVGAVDALAHAVGDNIGGWNDHPSRTQAEVVSALRQAAKRAAE